MPQRMPIAAAPAGRHRIAAGRDADQAGEHPVERQRQRRLSVTEPGREQCGERTRRSGDIGVHENLRGALLQGGGRYAHRAAGVESEPADPEDEDAQRGDGQIVPEDGRGFPFLYFPMRGPTSAAPTSASHPPTECTTADPAKSWKPRAASQPPPQVQCPASG